MSPVDINPLGSFHQARDNHIRFEKSLDEFMKKSTVIICDDAGFVRSILSQALEEMGLVVVAEATDGFEAEKLVQQYRPEFLVLDLVLPERNGVETILEIRKSNQQVKIIAMSNLDEENIQNKAFEAGCDLWLSKPFTKNQLRKVFSRNPALEEKIG